VPPAKRPRVEESWIEGDSESEDVAASESSDSEGDVDPLANLVAVEQLIHAGCGCANHNHYTAFKPAAVLHFQEQLTSMSSREVDLYVMGLLAARCTKNEPVVHNQPAAAAHPRSRITFSYSCISNLVCRSVFMKVHMSNVGKEPWNKFPQDVIVRTEQFIVNYASVYGLPMPAAPRGRGQQAPTYLPASSNYKDVHAEYLKESGDQRVMSYRAFVRLWMEKCKSIKFMTRRMDVCHRCEVLRDDIKSAATEEEKIKAADSLRDHVVLAQQEREYYVQAIDQASVSLSANPADPELTHLTFDFAEQFVLPHHARQPGPVYYKVMFRVNDFGIINEASKDQNKNKSVMAYISWRLLCGFEDVIKISFMVVGHTRCSVDGGFGLAKQKYRLGDIDTVQQLSDVINQSACSNVTSLKDWTWRNWDSFLQARFKRLAGITQYQHFLFHKDRPGEVMMTKTAADEDGITFQLLQQGAQDEIAAHVLPEVLPEAGLSVDRRAYLEKNVAVFCHPENKAEFLAALGAPAETAVQEQPAQ